MLLKGVPTTIARAGRSSLTIAAGNPGLATGGSGDVLSGILAALLAREGESDVAAAIAAQALGRAADLAARRVTARAMRPMDVIGALPDLWREWDVMLRTGTHGRGAGAPAPVQAETRVRARCRSVALLLVVACGQLHAQRARDWSPADRVVVGDFSIVRAAASGIDRLYVVGALGVMMQRTLEQRWEGPFGPPDAVVLERVLLAQVDPIDQSLWMVTSNTVAQLPA